MVKIIPSYSSSRSLIFGRDYCKYKFASSLYLNIYNYYAAGILQILIKMKNIFNILQNQI